MSVVALNSKPQEAETGPDFRGGAGLELYRRGRAGKNLSGH